MKNIVDPSKLVRLSAISIRPADIRWVEWNFTRPSGAVVTQIKMIDGALFVLEFSSKYYQQDLETLTFVANPDNWLKESSEEG